MTSNSRSGLAKILRGIDVPRARLHKELDALFFAVVSLTYGNKCLRCGAEPKQIVTKKGVARIQALTPHHFFCRSYWGTRWEPDNGFLLCYRCHVSWAQTRHEEFRDFVLQLIGPEKFTRLKFKALNGGKPDPGLTKMYLQQRLEILQAKRGST